jgi:hypothetical protein
MLGGFGPFFLFLLSCVPFFVVVYAMAVCAQYYAFFNFFHCGFVPPIGNELVDTASFGAGVYVMEVQRSGMVEPALSATEGGFVCLPFFFKGRPLFFGSSFYFLNVALVVRRRIFFELGFTNNWVLVRHYSLSLQ